jgi:hypothetical protein
VVTPSDLLPVEKSSFRQILIHRRGARNVIAPGVGQACQIEHGLQASIFASTPMQRQKSNIRGSNIGGTGCERHCASAHLLHY